MVIDKILHYAIRAQIYMMGFRSTYIIGVEMALDRRGIKDALTYSQENKIIILHKNKTVCFAKIPVEFSLWWHEDFNFIDYVYEQLDQENWN